MGMVKGFSLMFCSALIPLDVGYVYCSGAPFGLYLIGSPRKVTLPRETDTFPLKWKGLTSMVKVHHPSILDWTCWTIEHLVQFGVLCKSESVPYKL